ncbi:MAG: PaaI family thioesterase [Chloroflexi bacterium]|nr:PaaI family thioesterase [Chloroflexota bacterium]
MNQSPEEAARTAETIARLKSLEAAEPIAAFLQMRLLELSPGYARVSAKLKPEYRNFNGVIFGGIAMSLADQAFAYASNSLSHPSVATQMNVHFVAGPAVDDELIAECRVVRSGRRVGISQMTVTNQDGKLIAVATGTTVPLNSVINHEKPG